jgi:hypothetical protein
VTATLTFTGTPALTMRLKNLATSTVLVTKYGASPLKFTYTVPAAGWYSILVTGKNASYTLKVTRPKAG